MDKSKRFEKFLIDSTGVVYNKDLLKNLLDNLTKLKGKVVWQNSSNNSMANTTIQIDLSKYEYGEVVYSLNGTNTYLQISEKIYVGSGGKIFNTFWIEGAGDATIQREIRFNTSNIVIGPCYTLGNNETGSTVRNNFIVPKKIIMYESYL